MTANGTSQERVAIWLSAASDGRSDYRIEELASLLDDRERERAARFRFEHDRSDYVAAHVLLRLALSRAAEIAPDEWRFEADEYGKPAISGPRGAPALPFSLTHARGLVACAVAERSLVGVDVERVRPLDDALDLAKLYFSPAEIRMLEALSGRERLAHFFELWTLKESYAKARGLGLSLPLSTVSFDVEGGLVRCDLGERESGWRFGLSAPTREHLLAYAIFSETGADAVVSLTRI